MQKNEEYIVKIIDNGVQGEGIAKLEEKTVFIPNAIKDEKVKIKILKIQKDVCFGKILEIIEKSKYRIEPDCKYFEKCGGCNFRHIDYRESLNMKKKSVETTLRKALGREIEINEVIDMEEHSFYRNKLQYPVGVDKDGKTVMGIYQERSHRIIEVEKCMIQNEKCQKVAESIFEFLKQNNIKGYDEEKRNGYIRHIIVRIGIKTNEILVTLVTNNFDIPKEKELVEFVVAKNPEVKSIVKNLNNKNTNVILGQKEKVIFGHGYIYDFIGDKKFKISSKSFYQVNPVQTEKLYNKAIEYACLTGNETVFDLYCGIGTIGICASSKAGKLYGIETVEEAIKDAKENAKINNVENANFFVGDVEEVLPELMSKEKIEPDVVFIDPPRKGCDIKTIETLLKISAKRIVYVSCNPATLARDLKLLEGKYEIKKIAICDMFPGTRTYRNCCKIGDDILKETIYYNSFDEDVIENKNQNIKINKNFKWIHNNLLYKLCSKVLYAIAYTFGFFYSKFILHIKVENKEILKKYKNTGYFIYGNHTLPMGDAFNPVRVIDKKFFTIANQSNLGTPVIGKFLPMLGALIIPENISQMKDFLKAVNTRIDEGKAIVIYPEAHVWPYYTKIRNFNETSFKFPVDKNAISFCMTTTYYKRKNKDKPGIKIYVDGPFFPDETLPARERKAKLSKEIHEKMEERSKNSTYEYYKYILKRD